MNPLLTRFQFHKGSIRTAAVSQKRQFVHSFNSIKVQLELITTPSFFNDMHVSIP